jgi:hypothetical protein
MAGCRTLLMGTMMQWRRCFTERGYSSAQPDVSHLWRVQELRSEETNRLKGSDYEKPLSKNPGTSAVGT